MLTLTRCGWLTLIRRKWYTISVFCNDEGILKKCITDEYFKQTLIKTLPEDFIISHQEYLWSIDVISFFDNLDLIKWETTSYTTGFDTNSSVQWSEDIFNRFSNNITSSEGVTNISALISNHTLLFKDWDWDWIAISSNKSIVSDTSFISKIISQPSRLINKFIWSEVYPLHEIKFWNEHLINFEKNTNNAANNLFWIHITKGENVEFILSNYDFPWDWTYFTENCSAEVIVESNEDENLISKWDWQIATRKFEKDFILENLEEFAQFWDWEYILKDVFSVDIELRIEGGELPRIASCISILDSQRKKGLWKILTSFYTIESLFQNLEVTSNIDVFEWDWDTISANKHLPIDLVSLYNFKDKLNWSILSNNNSIQDQFNYVNWGKNRNNYFDNIVKYLKQFKKEWDWTVLSKNGNLNRDRKILRKFKEEDWDWEYLSEFGEFLRKGKQDKDNYLLRLFSTFPAINFSFFSKRNDVIIPSETILAKHEDNWDWTSLSSNPSAKITSDLIIKLRRKNWDWRSISTREDIELNNETILELLDKDWNWGHLSSHPSLEFNKDFIVSVKSKPLNWKVVSQQSSFSPSVETLTQTKIFDLDWTYLSKRKDLNPTKELLARFENNWDWSEISRQSNIDFKDTDLVNRFIGRWDWSFLCEEVSLAPNKFGVIF